MLAGFISVFMLPYVLLLKENISELQIQYEVPSLIKYNIDVKIDEESSFNLDEESNALIPSSLNYSISFSGSSTPS